jgi:uncharacterized membrane protein (DUF4010 family)
LKKVNYWQPYLIAIVIGLLIGIERERAHPNQKTLGVRTFLLISILGAIAGGIGNDLIAVLLTLFALTLIAISYYSSSTSKSPDVDRGLTTEFAAGIVFGLGFAAHHIPTVAALIGPIVALILFSKSTLHRFSHKIKASELETALLLLLGAVVVINLAPDQTIDPWQVFNPRKFGYLILILATLEFCSYVAVKLLGEKMGSLVVGFLGGFVSSSAVLLTSARQAAKEPKHWKTFVSAAIVAKLAALIELLIIVGLVTPTLIRAVGPAVVAGLLVGSLALLVLQDRKSSRESSIQVRSPLDWKGVFRLAITFGTILLAVSFAKQWFGESGTLAMSFITGLFELHGVSLANATMLSEDQITYGAAATNIFVALVASLLAKTLVPAFITRGKFTQMLALVFSGMAVAIFLTAWLTDLL